MKKLFVAIVFIGSVLVYSQVSSIPTASGSNPDTAVYLTRATDQDGTDKYCRSTSGNDTYVCGLTPALTAYTTGSCLVLNPDTANTTTATVNVDSLGAKSILNRAAGALSTGDITANAPISICYDGTQYIIQGDGASTGLADPGGNGFLDRTALNTTAARTLTGTTNQISITNGGGGGNPVFSLATGVLGGVQRVAYSSLPTCDAAITNVLVKLTDGFLNSHCNGTSYQWYYGDSPITLPGVVSGWTAVNSPTEAVDVAGAVYLRDASHNGAALKTLLKAISGSDWTITVGFLWEGQGQALATCGLTLSAGTTTSSRTLVVGITSADSTTSLIRIAYDYATNYTTTPAANRLNTGTETAPGSLMWARVTKVAGNWTYSFSYNGIKFTDDKTEAAPFTATHAGFGCDARGDGTADGYSAGTMFHYENQ